MTHKCLIIQDLWKDFQRSTAPKSFDKLTGGQFRLESTVPRAWIALWRADPCSRMGSRARGKAQRRKNE